MDLTEILARFWGIVLVVCGSALVINKTLLPELLWDKEKEEYFLITGFISLLLGAMHVASYNYWELSSRGLITLFGWSTLIKGAIRLTYPQVSKKAIGQVGTNKALYYPLFFLLMVVGMYLLFIGFIS